MILIVLILILLHVTFAEECTGSNWKACSLTKDSIKSYGAITISGKVTIEGVNDLTFTTLTIEESGNLSGVAGGYAAGQAHESCYKYNNNYAGGYHGGSSGYYPYTYSCGNYKEPVLMGGGAYHSRRGGAAVKITASTLIINGRIDMTGEGTSVSGGAGGSIWIITTTLSGTGLIKAAGGDGANGYSGGGGGRIAIYADNDTNFTGSINARGGYSTHSSGFCGSAGSIYKNINGYTTLTYKNNNQNTSVYSYLWSNDNDDNEIYINELHILQSAIVSTTSTSIDENTLRIRDQILVLGQIISDRTGTFKILSDHKVILLGNQNINNIEASITSSSTSNTYEKKYNEILKWNNAAHDTIIEDIDIYVHANAMFNIAGNLNLIQSNLYIYDLSLFKLNNLNLTESYLTMYFENNEMDQFEIINDIIIDDRSHLIFNCQNNIASDITLKTNNLYANNGFIEIEKCRILFEANYVNIESGFVIDGVGGGYAASQEHESCYRYDNNYAGGYHGGSSGYYGNAYSCGNYKEPILMGSGAHHSMHGGAAIKISVPNLIINGRIDMSGGGTSVSGGAGGSIWIITTTLSGTGVIKANGGDGANGYSGGGGGRIAIYANNDTEYTGTVIACGGYSSHGLEYHGSAGSIYKVINNYRTLEYNNNNRNTNVQSYLYANDVNIYKIVIDELILKGKAKVNLNQIDSLKESITNTHTIIGKLNSASKLCHLNILDNSILTLPGQLDNLNGFKSNEINNITNSLAINNYNLNINFNNDITLEQITLSVSKNAYLQLPTNINIYDSNIEFINNPYLFGTNLNNLSLNKTSLYYKSTEQPHNFNVTIADTLSIDESSNIYFKLNRQNYPLYMNVPNINIIKGYIYIEGIVYFNTNQLNIFDFGSINGVGLGYPNGQAHESCYKYNNNYGGGYHGGSSGYHQYDYSCGNYKEPILMGSGAHHSMAGGAAVKIITDSLIVNGRIDMTGGGTSVSGGAGGSIWIITKTLTGTGLIKAAGGDGASGYSGGGGGRIAIYTDNDANYTGSVNARGGTSTHSYAYHGSAGSIYKNINGIKHLIYDNKNLYSSIITHFFL